MLAFVGGTTSEAATAERTEAEVKRAKARATMASVIICSLDRAKKRGGNYELGDTMRRRHEAWLNQLKLRSGIDVDIHATLCRRLRFINKNWEECGTRSYCSFVIFHFIKKTLVWQSKLKFYFNCLGCDLPITKHICWNVGNNRWSYGKPQFEVPKIA